MKLTLQDVLDNYRFKTEKEIRKLYGAPYSINVVPEMYKYLGNRVNMYRERISSFREDVCSEDSIRFRIDDEDSPFASWKISDEMLTKINKGKEKDMSKTEKVGDSIEKCSECDKASTQISFTDCVASIPMMLKNVYFNEKNKTVTVLFYDGTVGVSTPSEDDKYDQKTGFCVAFANALLGSKGTVDRIVKHFNGEEAKELREKEMRKKILAERKLAEYKKKAEAGKKKRAQRELEEKKFRAEVEKKMLEEEKAKKEAKLKKEQSAKTEHKKSEKKILHS